MEIDKDIMSSIGYGTTNKIENRTTINDIFYKKDKCGVFILHFSDGSYYVGQALDIPKAYTRIKREHHDITHISYKNVKPEHQTEQKIHAIQMIEKKHQLRNITLSSFPKPEHEFDLIITPEEQAIWLSEANPVPSYTLTTPHNSLRYKYKACFQKLMADEFFNDKILPVMKKYVALCIPEPYKTQIDYWGCTCFPDGHGDEDKLEVYSRINLYWQEVFSAGQIVVRDKTRPLFTWHLSKKSYSLLTVNEKEAKFIKIYSIKFSDHFYEKGGEDQFKITVHSTEDALALLDDRLIVNSIKQFNLRNMRRGPQVYARYHCMDLADLIMLGSNAADKTLALALGVEP